MAKRIPYVLRKASIFSVLLFLVIFLAGTDAKAGVSITAEQLADICERMEQSITDITVEYDWLVTPPYTHADLAQQGFTRALTIKDGTQHFFFSANGLALDADRFDPNQFPRRFRLDQTATLELEEGKSWERLIQQSYDGSVGKYLSIGGWPKPAWRGRVLDQKPSISLALSPLGFSVLRPAVSGDRIPLSKRLRFTELVRLDDSVRKVSDFNCVCVDFLSERSKRPCHRVYFSIDHGYTPVMYLYTKGDLDKVAFSVEVLSLQEVGEDLWFPETGKIVAPDDPHINVYAAKGDIKINQGLGPEDFDIDFPPGTKVDDEIRDVEYVVAAEQ